MRRLFIYTAILTFPADVQSQCPASAGLERTWRPNLYCVDLLAVPGLDASGIVKLLPPRSPFDVAVDREGHAHYRAQISVRNLPDPHTLGSYTTYVAWVSTLVLKPIVKLGVVANEAQLSADVGFDQFMILVTAEASADVTERHGRIVLRGMSSSARMRPTDLMLMTNGSSGKSSNHHQMHGAHGELEWSMPPMDALLPTTPWLENLQPTTAPFLPAGSAPPVAHTRAIRAADGDTIVLTAAKATRTISGRVTTGYAYNGQAAGPLLDVKAGSTLTLRLHNRMDLPTSVHWHGIRLENRFDGAVGMTQHAVEPGRDFDYRVKFPDPGVYWYHAHVREDVQQTLGLFGNILVRSPADDRTQAVDREEALIVSDLLLNEQGVFPFGSKAATHALMGRFGNTFLVNGEADARMSVGAGSVVRFYLTNASGVRPYNLSFGDLPMKLVGADGGKLERDEWVTSIPIAPAQRYVVDVRFDTVPRPVALVNRVQVTNHAFGNLFSEADTLLRISVHGHAASRAAKSFTRLRERPELSREFARYRAYTDKPPDHTLALTLRVKDLPLGLVLNTDTTYFAPVEWGDIMQMMSWLPTGNEVQWILRDMETGRENTAIDWKFRVGDVVKIRLFNDPTSFHPMQHPIHLHGQRFLVLSRDGVPNDNLVWKDTVLVPVGSSVDILLDVSNPGMWMMHCHISEHLESGMHAMFSVSE